MTTLQKLLEVIAETAQEGNALIAKVYSDEEYDALFHECEPMLQYKDDKPQVFPLFPGYITRGTIYGIFILTKERTTMSNATPEQVSTEEAQREKIEDLEKRLKDASEYLKELEIELEEERMRMISESDKRREAEKKAGQWKERFLWAFDSNSNIG